MTFHIDFSRYRLVDLSIAVLPNQSTPGRPFHVREGRLDDGTRKFDIINTHTHVGTHVESPWHFYGAGSTITDFPLEKFMGNARLLKGILPPNHHTVPIEYLQQQLDPHRGQFSILFIRNDTSHAPLQFDTDSVPYLASLGLDILAFDATIAFGRSLEDGQRFHEQLLGNETLLAEFPDNARDIDRDGFYLFAVPIKLQSLDAAPCRMFAVLER